MEPKPPYTTGQPPADPDNDPHPTIPVICPVCGSVVGNLTPGPDGRLWLQLPGGLMVQILVGAHCGEEWQFRASEQDLARLIRRALENRRKMKF